MVLDGTMRYVTAANWRQQQTKSSSVELGQMRLRMPLSSELHASQVP